VKGYKQNLPVGNVNEDGRKATSVAAPDSPQQLQYPY